MFFFLFFVVNLFGRITIYILESSIFIGFSWHLILIDRFEHRRHTTWRSYRHFLAFQIPFHPTDGSEMNPFRFVLVHSRKSFSIISLYHRNWANDFEMSDEKGYEMFGQQQINRSRLSRIVYLIISNIENRFRSMEKMSMSRFSSLHLRLAATVRRECLFFCRNLNPYMFDAYVCF